MTYVDVVAATLRGGPKQVPNIIRDKRARGSSPIRAVQLLAEIVCDCFLPVARVRMQLEYDAAAAMAGLSTADRRSEKIAGSINPYSSEGIDTVGAVVCLAESVKHRFGPRAAGLRQFEHAASAGTSSVCCRSEDVPIVVEHNIRHWLSTILTIWRMRAEPVK